MRLAVRIALALVLCVALVGIGVHYAESYDDRWPYASEDELVESYTDHLDEEVLLFGVVTDVDTEHQELTFVVETEDGMELTFVSDHVPMDMVRLLWNPVASSRSTAKSERTTELRLKIRSSSIPLGLRNCTSSPSQLLACSAR